MSSIEAGEKTRVTRPALLAVLAVVMFMLSAMLRQYREITVPVAILLAAWAAYAYMQGRRGA
jgi:uncharacterized membrane protein YhhN